jgi:hypothetical protein
VKSKKGWKFVVFALLTNGLFSCSAKADKSVANAIKDLPPNAYYYYVKALDVRRQATRTNHTPPPPPAPPPPLEPKPYHYEENPAEIKADADALEIVRHGFAFKYTKVQSESETFYGGNIPFNSGMREIARMLAKESDARAATGNWAGSANSAIDGIRLGQDISHGTIIDMLVGRAIQAITSKNFDDILTHIDASTARADTKRLENILSQKVTYADILQKEKQIGLYGYEQFAADPNWKDGYEKHYHVKATQNVQDLKSIYIKAMDDLIANARLPYPQRKTSIKKPGDPLNQMMLGLYSDPKSIKNGAAQGLQHAVQQTKNVFVLVEFALRAYYLEHGKYPETLNELTPDYLQKISDDPFSSNQPLLYKRDKETYLLYSIGPDGKDDDGKSAGEKFIPADAKGDIVAGVKNW